MPVTKQTRRRLAFTVLDEYVSNKSSFTEVDLLDRLSAITGMNSSDVDEFVNQFITSKGLATGSFGKVVKDKRFRNVGLTKILEKAIDDSSVESIPSGILLNLSVLTDLVVLVRDPVFRSAVGEVLFDANGCHPTFISGRTELLPKEARLLERIRRSTTESKKSWTFRFSA